MRVPEPPLTPHELHQKSISVLDQLARIESACDRGAVPSAPEIDVIGRAATGLRRRIEETARDLPDAGAVASGHLAAARARVVESLVIVDRLAARIEDRGGEAPSVTRRPEAGPASAD